MPFLKSYFSDDNHGKPLSGWRFRLHEIIFEADTKLGKWFDIVLMLLIIISIVAVLLDSIESIRQKYSIALHAIEWIVTIVFTIEYFFRFISVNRPLKYVFSFYGIIDFLTLMPTYLALFVSGSQSLMIIRVLRLLRVFRILKLTRYLGEAKILRLALEASFPKIIVFLISVISLSLIVGTLMYLIEGQKNGFTSIPKSWYWAIVTMTTVGYGDIAPKTVFGQFVASLLMLAGYGIIAVPTGIVSAELTSFKNRTITNTQVCPSCCAEGHDDNATYCKLCGAELNPEQPLT